MIVGTAGHIDHGKTTLVRALTGVDTDRLPEEKQRGISIELGYAFLDVPASDQRIGFIDVPGHERLVHTMLAGASGIDHALLLVAADDGVMPQTREHLAVLSLLGLRRGTVLITKCDRAEPTRIAALQGEIGALLAGSGLDQAPVLALSAHTGQGLEALRRRLFAEAREARPEPEPGQGFRLAIDRAFSLDGVGTIVTGTVHAGQVRIGDELQLCPAAHQPLRVRSLHAQNRAVDAARAGQRCAVGLAGLARDEVRRGQWLVAPGIALASSRLDVHLRLWPAESRPLRSGTPVHVHLGARSVMGTLAVLRAAGGGDALQPGAEGWVQLLLREPIAAWQGERVVLRDAAASRTLAGGVVLDPFAPGRYRRSPQRLAELAALQLPTARQRLVGLLAARPMGLDLGRLAMAEGRPQTEDLLAHLPAQAVQAHEGGQHWALDARAAQDLTLAVTARLAAYHAGQPEEIGPESARLRRLVAPRLAEPLWRALLAQWRADGSLALRGAFVHLPAHGVQLSATEQRIAQKVAPRLDQTRFEGAWVRDLARDCAESEALMRTALARLAQQGELHQLVKDLFYSPAQMRSLAGIARAVAAAHAGRVLAADFRDATGLGRKRAIQILEYFDRAGLLRRVGDVHKLRAESELFREDR